MTNSVRNTQDQIRRYWVDDGIPDLYIGAGFLIYAAILWWNAQSSQNWVNIFSTVILILMVVFARMLIGKTKEIITYPRTGYIKYATFPSKDIARRVMLWLGVAVLIALVALVALITGGKSAGLTLIWILIPLVFSAIIGSIAYMQRSSRYVFYAVLSLICGLGTVVISQNFPVNVRNALLNGVGILFPLGLVMIIVGVWTLINYLRHHPVSVQEL